MIGRTIKLYSKKIMKRVIYGLFPLKAVSMPGKPSLWKYPSCRQNDFLDIYFVRYENRAGILDLEFPKPGFYFDKGKTRVPSLLNRK